MITISIDIVATVLLTCLIYDVAKVLFFLLIVRVKAMYSNWTDRDWYTVIDSFD